MHEYQELVDSSSWRGEETFFFLNLIETNDFTIVHMIEANFFGCNDVITKANNPPPWISN